MGCACGSSNIVSNQAISAGASTKGSSGHAVWECRHLVAFWPFPNLPDPCCPSAGDAACLQCLPVWPGQLLCHTGQSASSREQVWTRQNCSGTYHRMTDCWWSCSFLSTASSGSAENVRVILVFWGAVEWDLEDVQGECSSWIWLLSSEFYALAHNCSEIDEHGFSDTFSKWPLAVRNTMPAVGTVCLWMQLPGNAHPVLATINTWTAVGSLSAGSAQLGWQDGQAHISQELDAVTPCHECLWPFNVTRLRWQPQVTWLRHAMLRTEQLVWDMHLAFAAVFVQLSGL